MKLNHSVAFIIQLRYSYQFQWKRNGFFSSKRSIYTYFRILLEKSSKFIKKIDFEGKKEKIIHNSRFLEAMDLKFIYS